MLLFQSGRRGVSKSSKRRAGGAGKPASGRQDRRRQALLGFEQCEDRTLLAVTFWNQPDAAYLAAAPNLIPITIADGATTTTLADANLTVTFNASMTARTVPGGWSNWGSPPNTESNTPRVLDSGAAANTVTLNFSKPLATFGLEWQQASFSTLALDAQYFNGVDFVAGYSRSTTVPGAPVGAAGDGAKLNAISTSDQAITRVVLTAPAGANGFALAQVRYALAQADLVVTKTVSTPQANPGDTLTYTISVTNTGPNVALNPVINDTVPAGLDNPAFMFGTTPSGWVGIFNVGPGTLQYVGPDLASGESATFTFSIPVAAATAPGTNLVNTATGSSDTNDPDPSDDSGSATTLVVSPIVNVNGTAGSDNFLVQKSADGQSLEVYVGGVLTISQLLSTVDQVLVNGLGGDDKLTVDNDNGLLSIPNGIDFAGGSENDILIVTGNPGGINSATYTPGATADAGTIFVDGTAGDQTITFSGLEPVEFLMPTPLLAINGTAAANTINVINDGPSVGLDPITGLSELTYEVNYAGAFELIRFRNAAQVNINGLGGADTITNDVATRVDALSPSALTTLNILGGDGNDVVQVLQTPAGVTTTVNTEFDFDEVYVGVLAAAYNTGVGNLDGINGPLSLLEAGIADLFIDDTADATDDSIVFTSTSITGASPAVVTYAPDFVVLELRGGTGNDKYDIQSTASFLNPGRTTIADAGGTNTWTIAGDQLNDVNEFLGGPDDDKMTLNAGAGLTGTSILLNGGQGSNNVTVVGTSGADAITASWFTPGQYDVTGLGTVANLLNATFATVDGGGGFDSLLLEDASGIAANTAIAPQSASSVLVGIDNLTAPNFGGVNLGSFTVNGDSDGSGDKDGLVVFGTSTTGLEDFFEATSPNGSDLISVSDSLVDIFNTVLGPLLSVNLVTNTFVNLNLLAGNENPQLGDDITATPSTQLQLFIRGQDPTIPASPGDTLNVFTAGDVNLYNDPALGPVNYVIEDSAGGGTIMFTEIETINVSPGTGVLNLKGDRFDNVAEEDLFVVRGTGQNAGDVRINDPGITQSAVNFFGVNTLRVFGYQLADTLDITPYADNTPQNWDVEVYFDEGDSPILSDLLIYNGVAGVSENIVVQPSGALAGQLIVTQAVNNFPVVTINYISNLGITVNANDGSLGDTDQLFLRDATGSPPTTNGNAIVDINLGAAGGAADPLVTVADGLAGTLYEIWGLSNFNAINVELGNGDDQVTLTAVAAITANIDVGAGNDRIDASASTIGVTLSGGPGNDLLIGGQGPDTLFGNDGNDILVGGAGDDSLFGDAGSDRFESTYLDGNDTVDGGEGDDVIVVAGNPIVANEFDVSRSGGGTSLLVQLVTGVNSASVSAAEVEQANLLGSTQSDDFVIRDLWLTDAILINVNTSGTNVPDAAADCVCVNGRNVADDIAVVDAGGEVQVEGLKAQINVSQSTTLDTMAVYANAGNDNVAVIPPVASLISIQLHGGFGNDTLTGGNQMSGGEGDDTLIGTNGPDTLVGGPGNDLIRGLGGNDILIGDAEIQAPPAGDCCGPFIPVPSAGFGDDTIYGDAGNDSISGTGGNDLLYGGDDDDLIGIITVGAFVFGDPGNDTVYAGTGNDNVNSDSPRGAGLDPLGTTGEAGNDLIYGGADNDTLHGGDGNDTAYGGDGNDTIAGEAGNDILLGEAGNDSIMGGDGNDALDGGDGNDVMSGGDGNDSLLGRDGNDTMAGDAGNDSLFGGDGNDVMSGGDGNDTLCGEAGDDSLAGDAGDDLLIGGIGNDTLSGGTGADIIFGGEGDDLASGGDGDDFLMGGVGNDTLNGDDGNDYIFGEAGNDLLVGGLGNDTLVGGIGDDRIHGGNGVFRPVHGPEPVGLPFDGDDWLIGEDGFDQLDAGNGNNYLDAGYDNFREFLVAGSGNDQGFLHKALGPKSDVGALDGGNNVEHSDGFIQAPLAPVEPPCNSASYSVFTISTVPGIDAPALVAGIVPPNVVRQSPTKVVPISKPAPVRRPAPRPRARPVSRKPASALKVKPVQAAPTASMRSAAIFRSFLSRHIR